ncbi:MAG: type II 3-dehydroquinate dehydratase [Polyangiaceae bacterium]|nr:type II 3-dehydroquinate dehydratase [Myxococcales bacterium]MCB9584267.1 type II 3-dehydroquinate dehydratase [Polyangiaceae bacterium]MCB9608570.1 type II 3-dehydroquinate dehydratase [Polyangiaceae bacterium]
MATKRTKTGATSSTAAAAKAASTRTPKRRRFLVLSGPNLQRLGKREPEVYGRKTLEDIHVELARVADDLSVEVDCKQSNYEGELVGWLGEAGDQGFSGILINPGALTHYSYALHDAIKASGLPCVELHLSNPDAREEFRHVSVVAAVCVGRVAGFGADSYRLALIGLVQKLASKR